MKLIRSEEQLSDILTKPLDSVKFLDLHIKISIIDVNKHNKSYEENVRK
jgi:hypothetical protein